MLCGARLWFVKPSVRPSVRLSVRPCATLVYPRSVLNLGSSSLYWVTKKHRSAARESSRNSMWNSDGVDNMRHIARFLCDSTAFLLISNLVIAKTKLEVRIFVRLEGIDETLLIQCFNCEALSTAELTSKITRFHGPHAVIRCPLLIQCLFCSVSETHRDTS